MNTTTGTMATTRYFRICGSSGALRDESISVYAQMLAPQSYQSAQIWAAAIEDSSLRMLCHQAIRRFAP